MTAMITRFCSVNIVPKYKFVFRNATISALDIEVRDPRKSTVVYDVKSAISNVKATSKAKFDESIELAIALGVDPRKPNQSVRGLCQLPHGTGKTVRVAVFVNEEKEAEALEAGASIAGGLSLVKIIQEGKLDFDRCVATPDMMPLVGRVARILGPRGLMPNPKLGTVTQDISKAIKAAKAGQVEFKAEKKGIVQAAIGKVSFSEKQLLENVKAFMIALSNAKPEGAKGKYMKRASMCSTMGKGHSLDLLSLDPSSSRFMLFEEK